MPWYDSKLDSLINKAKNKIKVFYPNNTITAEILLTNQNEMRNEIFIEGKMGGLSESQLERRKFLSKYVVGKYFSFRNEIWILEGKEGLLNTINNEFLHSIQKCKPNREKIVDYLTYKLTKDQNGLRISFINEWTNIEQKYGLKLPINQLLIEKDCEDF